MSKHGNKQPSGSPRDKTTATKKNSKWDDPAYARSVLLGKENRHILKTDYRLVVENRKRGKIS